jgi:hypothetical protein
MTLKRLLSIEIATDAFADEITTDITVTGPARPRSRQTTPSQTSRRPMMRRPSPVRAAGISTK